MQSGRFGSLDLASSIPQGRKVGKAVIAGSPPGVRSTSGQREHRSRCDWRRRSRNRRRRTRSLIVSSSTEPAPARAPGD